MWKKAAVVVIVVIGLLIVLWLAQRRLIYFPSSGPVAPVPGAQDVTLLTSDGLRLAAWRFPPTGPDRRLAVLVANGNGGDRSMRVTLADALRAKGFTVLLFDYRGYGGNPGSPSEPGLYRDVRAAFAHLTETFPPERIILFGESLGCAMVTDLATEHTPGGLVLRSPFTDLPAAGAHHYPFLPVRWLLRDKYPVAEKLSRVPAEVVVILGTRDSIVPPGQSRQVASRAQRPAILVEIPGADHNDPALFDGPEVIAAVTALAGRIAPPA